MLILLSGLEEGVIAAFELGFEFGPCATESGGDGTAFCDVVDTFVVKDGFEFATELCAEERFIEEVEPERGVLEFLANLPEAFLAVDEAIDDGAEGVFKIEERCGWVGH
jgi:hypothetical protein